MEVTRKNILTKVGITPIETANQLQKDIKLQQGETIALGLLAAFEAGVIVTMGMVNRRRLKADTISVPLRSTSSEEYYDEEELQ